MRITQCQQVALQAKIWGSNVFIKKKKQTSVLGKALIKSLRAPPHPTPQTKDNLNCGKKKEYVLLSNSTVCSEKPRVRMGWE